MAIFKKRGKWWIGFPLGNRKYRREAIGPSYALARQILAKRLTEVAERREFPGRVANARTFLEVATKYWELEGQYLKSSIWVYMLAILKTEFGSRKIGSITVADIQSYYNRKRNETSNTTANRWVGLLSVIFNRARVWGDFYGENPCTRIQRGRETAHRLRFLSHDEMDHLLAVVHPRLYPIVMCALLTGMRRGEMLGLTWENVSLDQDTLYILESKSGKPRELPIPGKLREVLLSLGPKPAGKVFDLPVIMLRRFFAQALKDAGIFGFRFHDLRHTFASHFLMKTNDLPALQRLLGHSSPVMTQRYAHLSRGHMASNMAVFEAAIPVKSGPPALGIAPILHHPIPTVTPV